MKEYVHIHIFYVEPALASWKAGVVTASQPSRILHIQEIFLNEFVF